MDSPSRRTLDELVTRYQFHPELRDLYVEGDRDLSLFRWFFERLPDNTAVVYHINTVDIPREISETVGVASEGNKGRVITLALKLVEALPPECQSIYGCVDKDFHGFGPNLPECRFLVCTDHTSMECYVLKENPISKLFRIYLGKSLVHSELESMTTVLRYVFFVRLAKYHIAPSAKWFEKFTTCCSVTDGQVLIDRQEFLSRVVNAAAGSLNIGQIDDEVKRLLSLPGCEKQRVAHGHDIIQLISWVGHRKGVAREVCDPAPLQRAMLSLLEFQDLEGEPLFAKLSTWASQGT